MITVHKMLVGELNTCCYIVTDSLTNDTIIIDAGDEFEKINNYIECNNLNVNAVFLTHGHYDHIGACIYFKQKGVPIYIHEKDADKCENNNLNLSNRFCEHGIHTFKPDILILGEEQDFKIGSIKIKAIHTAGHSEGGCSFIIENYLFSGDTIFNEGYGRTDFYDGSMLKLRQSIRKLIPYVQDGYILCAGHG